MKFEEGEDRIIPLNIEEEMKSAYIDYSMSVIVSRALPDVRDGLKPVHRRVLYGMSDLGLVHNRPHKKSARIVGEVLGKYHPHGDSSVYDTMVRMAQDWSLRYPLVDGQGNFGSIDGDSPAAMRYTEARMTRIAEEMLIDIDKNTVDFAFNFDETLKEPTVLPAKIPNLLINGISGIAVGMATNMAPHNLSEIIDAVFAYIENNDVSIEELMEHVKAPDFPTGGIIYGYQGVRDGFLTGRGRVVTRGKAVIETTDSGRERIIVTEVPYMVNKANMIMKTADLVEEKIIEGISDINDESDRNGYRVVYDLKRDAVANVVLNKLYKYTALQTSFSINNIALVKGRPKALNLLDLIRYYVEHRHEIVIRRTQFELDEAKKRAHILEGLIIALDNLDEVIALIRSSQTPELARNGLMSKFELSEAQSRAILDMRLQKLTGLEIENLRKEYNELMKHIEYLESILNDEELRMKIIKDELIDVKKKFGDERRTEIEYSAGDFRMEDIIPDEEVVITITHLGYIKRTPISIYKTQNRGGRGAKGAGYRTEDFIEHLFIASTHSHMLFFTEKGKCYWIKVYEIPDGAKTNKGRAIQNLLQIEPDDRILAYITIKDLEDTEYLNNNFLIFCTKNGTIKKTPVEAYSRPRQKGIIATKINEDDQLLQVEITNGTSEILIATKNGQAIRFNEEKVRKMGRVSAGVRGIRLGKGDEVVGMVCVQDKEDTVLVVSDKGYGKRSALEDYRITNRGGKGVKTINITEKTGNLVAIKNVKETDDLMIINRSGLTIRMSVEDLRVMGRATQGVRLIRLNEEDEIAAVAKIAEVKNENNEEVENPDELLSSNDESEISDTADNDDTLNDEKDTE